MDPPGPLLDLPRQVEPALPFTNGVNGQHVQREGTTFLARACAVTTVRTTTTTTTTTTSRRARVV